MWSYQFLSFILSTLASYIFGALLLGVYTYTCIRAFKVTNEIIILTNMKYSSFYLATLLVFASTLFDINIANNLTFDYCFHGISFYNLLLSIYLYLIITVNFMRQCILSFCILSDFSYN